ncbi:hypothetical protein QT381_01230 [Galbitalea sp. SE-J8]|uniref:hypothetical protein n=1 Tax=Galbitalea sp. SE-J8 TaxID=3054952 RepID=UPI00259D08F5|nr:hypothetical protein [Galbitalea sp. SE-J8]MDM4761630.1 hypothetical protein [Galbitalea sp. SE-J8]
MSDTTDSTTNTDPYSGGELPADPDLAPAPDDVKDDAVKHDEDAGEGADEKLENVLPEGTRADREEPLP